VKVDCATVAAPDLEKLLFATAGSGNSSGEERRSLERVRRSAHLYQSRGGTLFLQNLVELPARTQLRLSRVLRDGEVVIMDEGTRVELDHRVITAGDPSIDGAVHDGRLITDLHRRLCAFRVELPPLRTRKEDIPGLALHFVKGQCQRANVPCKVLSDSAQSLLAALPWKGNAVELRALLEGLVMRVEGRTIGLNDVLGSVQLDGRATVPVRGSLREARTRFEGEYIAAVLAQHHGRIPEAAKTLGIQRSNLYRKMRRLQVPKPNGSTAS
jgi:DNA-binding NtrC family response regulator